MAVTMLAPAKINLSLEVLRRRPDGFHDIASIVQAIDLTDEITLRVERGERPPAITLSTRGAPVPPGPENLAWRAAESWLTGVRDDTGRPPLRIELQLEKRIPPGSGLGGGSSDAAAVLLGLNRLCGRPLGAAALYRTAAELGSDVPFFLAGGTCRIDGRGERVRRIPSLPPLTIVLVIPAEQVATAWAYAARSAEHELTATGESSSILEFAIRKRSPALIGRHLFNDFEHLVARSHAVVAEVLEELRGSRAIGASMTGSGSSMFALFEDHGEASRLAEMLHRNHPVHVCRPYRGGPRSAAADGLAEFH